MASAPPADAQRRSVRATRMAPASTSRLIAASADVSPQQQQQALRDLQGRGACAQTAAVAAAGAASGPRLLALTHRACPPPSSALLSETAAPAEAFAARGAPAWATRPPLGPYDLNDRVACHPRLAQRTLCQMANSHNTQTRADAAQNPACAAGMLIVLAQDPDPAVRADAVMHQRCPLELATLLAADPHVDVRFAAVRRYGTSQQTLERLSEHHQHRAGRRSALPSWLPKSLDQNDYIDVRAVVAGRADCPPELLEYCAEDHLANVRAAAAANPACPPELLTKLAGDAHDYVRAAAAANPACPPELLEAPAREPLHKL